MNCGGADSLRYFLGWSSRPKDLGWSKADRWPETNRRASCPASFPGSREDRGNWTIFRIARRLSLILSAVHRTSMAAETSQVDPYFIGRFAETYRTGPDIPTSKSPHTAFFSDLVNEGRYGAVSAVAIKLRKTEVASGNGNEKGRTRGVPSRY